MYREILRERKKGYEYLAKLDRDERRRATMVEKMHDIEKLYRFSRHSCATFVDSEPPDTWLRWEQARIRWTNR